MSEKELVIDSVNKTFELNHAYARAGSYLVTATLNDDDGGTITDTFAVNVAIPEVEFTQVVFETSEHTESGAAIVLQRRNAGMVSQVSLSVTGGTAQ